MITANWLADPGGSRGQHCGLFAVDVVGRAGPARDVDIQLFLRESLYELLARAFRDARLDWDDCLREDRGDGMLMIVPGHMLSAAGIDPLVDRLRTGLRRHNRVVTEAARIRLRVAIHYGEVHRDDHGVFGADLNHVFRLLDAPALKRALAESGGDLGLVVSDYVYHSVIRHNLIPADPAAFRPVRVAVKETRARAWLHLPGASATMPWLQPGTASHTPRPVTTPGGPHQAGEDPARTLASPSDHSDQVLDSILAAGEAEELQRIQDGLNLDAGLAAIMQGGPHDPIPAADADDSGEPQILAEVVGNPRTPEVLPFRWVRKG
jgi:class 3 adenylate cyclase